MRQQHDRRDNNRRDNNHHDHDRPGNDRHDQDFPAGTSSKALTVCAVCLGRHAHSVYNCSGALRTWDGAHKAVSKRAKGELLLHSTSAPICLEWQWNKRGVPAASTMPNTSALVARKPHRAQDFTLNRRRSEALTHSSRGLVRLSPKKQVSMKEVCTTSFLVFVTVSHHRFSRPFPPQPNLPIEILWLNSKKEFSRIVEHEIMEMTSYVGFITIPRSRSSCGSLPIFAVFYHTKAQKDWQVPQHTKLPLLSIISPCPIFS